MDNDSSNFQFKVNAKRSLHINRIVYFATSVIAIILLLSTAYFFLKEHSVTPLDSYQKLVKFQLYYLKELPDNYHFINGSATASDYTLTFKISVDSKEVTITEQEKPNNLDSFRVDGFNSISTSIGTMLVGNTQGASVAIITSPTTLITINGFSQDIVTDIGQKLQKLSN